MKKKIIFLILLLTFITQNVKAENATFYEAEYIDGIYMNKYNFNTKTTYYQKARFFRKTGTNEYAYCIEPFSFFQENTVYEETMTPYNLSKEKIEKISKIAYYGYGYQNHTDPKWYAITQMMIWQVSDDAGNYYFSDTLNGNAANLYLKEEGEINQLISQNEIVPSFVNNTYTIVEDHEIIIEDVHNVLENYNTTQDYIKTNQNKLIISGLKEGNYTIQMEKKKDNRNTPILFYQSKNSQNLVKAGYLQEENISFQLKVIKTYLELNKIDKDTKSIIPSGEASLDGAVFEIQKEDSEKIDKLIIEDNQGILWNLDFGKYYIKEIQAGEGYQLNPTTYEIEIKPETPKQSLTIENEVLKKKVTLQKQYGDNTEWKEEDNVSFWIKNDQEEIINTITTNKEGKTDITLPYGKYSIIQINSKEGYQKIDPFMIEINNTEDETIVLKDLKIPVPNTHIQNNILIKILKALCFILI